MSETSGGPPPDRRFIESRAVAAYLGLALGDALGATVEFMTPREIAAQYGSHDRIRGGGWLRLKPGHVTDDTTMALALGESILRKRRVDPFAAAQAFDAWMRARPVDIGNTVRRGLIEFRRTGEPVAAPSEYSAGNGACMRVLPVALATLGAPEDDVRAACRYQSHVTHNNALSDAATECVVDMVQRAMLGAGKAELAQACIAPLAAGHREFDPQGRREENPSGFIVPTLRAVFQALLATDSFEACLVDAVNRGGDADTTGAIAGKIAGALYGCEALPVPWLQVLDRNTRSACERQARALLELSPAWRGM
ncbi:MAG: ADP-ribosyl-[dinitrogen reductase] hydrolase [Rhodocyclaceae bacterium]